MTPHLVPHTQTAKENISVPHVQREENNVSMLYGHVFGIGPNLELMAISYSNNQPADTDL